MLCKKVGETVRDKILFICEVMNRHDYTPRMDEQSDLDLAFNTGISDVMPYLFRVRSVCNVYVLGTCVGFMQHLKVFVLVMFWFG